MRQPGAPETGALGGVERPFKMRDLWPDPLTTKLEDLRGGLTVLKTEILNRNWEKALKILDNEIKNVESITDFERPIPVNEKPEVGGMYLVCVKNFYGHSWKIKEFFEKWWMLDEGEDGEDAEVVCWQKMPVLPRVK